MSIAHADSAGEPGAPVAYAEFFTLLDATQFIVTQSWVLAITREREHLAARIVRGGPVDAAVFAAVSSHVDITRLEALGTLTSKDRMFEVAPVQSVLKS